MLSEKFQWLESEAETNRVMNYLADIQDEEIQSTFAGKSSDSLGVGIVTNSYVKEVVLDKYLKEEVEVVVECRAFTDVVKNLCQSIVKEGFPKVTLKVSPNVFLDWIEIGFKYEQLEYPCCFVYETSGKAQASGHCKPVPVIEGFELSASRFQYWKLDVDDPNKAA